MLGVSAFLSQDCARSPCSLCFDPMLAPEKSSQEEVEKVAGEGGISKRKRGGAPPDKAPRHLTTATARGEGCGATAGPSPSPSSPAAKSKPSPVPPGGAHRPLRSRGSVWKRRDRIGKGSTGRRTYRRALRAGRCPAGRLLRGVGRADGQRRQRLVRQRRVHKQSGVGLAPLVGRVGRGRVWRPPLERAREQAEVEA